MREAMPSFLDKLQDLLAVQSGDPGARRLIKHGSGEFMGKWVHARGHIRLQESCS